MRTLRLVFPFALTVAGFAACGGGGLVPSDAGPGAGGMPGSGGAIVGTGGAIIGSGGSGLGAGSPGGEGGAGGMTGSGFGGAAPACDRHVHILLQKSGAVFEFPSIEDNWWDAVAEALTGGLVQEFDAQVELSLSVYSKHEGAESCPVGAEVSAPIDASDLEDTLSDEKADYEESILSVNVDAPIVQAVEEATELLSGEENAYILLIASGIPDSCEINNNVCTVEDVFTAIGAAHEAGIETRLLYLSSTDTALYPEGIANAGAGEGIASSPSFNCGTGFEYSDQPGSTPFGQPENADAVEQALADILGDIAACD